MSVILKSEKCVYISHNKYIQKAYGDQFKLNEDLFEINAPFKKQTLKRKRADEATFTEITEDVEHVRKEYSKFYKALSDTSKVRNVKALDASRKLYEESGTCVRVNTTGGNLLQPALVEIEGAKYLFPPDCRFFCKDVKDLRTGLFKGKGKFDVVLMDPPWWNKAVRRNKHAYKMMSNSELELLPVGDLLSEDGLVVVWCTNSPQHIQACNGFFEKWGVKLVAKWFWLKVCSSGETVINFADPPCKLPFERILIGARKEDRNLAESSGTILVSVPSALHSHKPPLAEVLQPYLKADAKCLELFARYLLPGYTSYGLEVLRFQNACLYEDLRDGEVK